MSHKEKICQPALTSHIETSHDQCSYTPLVVSRKIWKELPEKPGIKSLITDELNEVVASKSKGLKEKATIASKLLKENIEKAFEVTLKKIGDKQKYLSIESLKKDAIEIVDKDVESQYNLALNNTLESVVESSEGRFDIGNPKKAIDYRVSQVQDMVDKTVEKNLKIKPIPVGFTQELDGLGLFFSDSVKKRSEGKVYSVCGPEFTILPGEEIKERNTLKTTVKTEDSIENTVSENLTNTNRNEVTDTFEKSFERNLTKQLDVKLSKELNVGAKIPFKLFSLNLSSKTNSSVDFKRILKEVTKSSHKQIKKTFDEVVRKINTSTTSNFSRTTTSSVENVFDRKWQNNTDKPQIYMKRKGYCKTSVIHTRNNVQLAWSGCIDDPAKDLCTPDNIEGENAKEIQAIREKWANTSAPSEFGPKPENKKRCTGLHTYVSAIGSKKHVPINDTIPAGWYYDGGSQLEIVSSTTTPQSSYVSSQPSIGAVGGISFDTYVDVKNKAFHTERASVRVCYIIAPIAAKEWNDKVQNWRAEKAQEEIDVLIAEKTEELDAFLETDQAHQAIVRRIYQDYFGVTSIEDCCKLIAKIQKIFDFNSLCYSLLPSWNELGEGCQKSQSVNIYNAKCLHFYLPVKEGKEIEAIALLVSINAIPWNSQLATQILAYVNQIQNMRDTIYNRDFDPTGWDVKFDQPKGYDMTPYDTANPDWSSAFETSRNYEVLGAFTINVPCGERLEPRPLLCE